jgi:hypothetical protein
MYLSVATGGGSLFLTKKIFSVLPGTFVPLLFADCMMTEVWSDGCYWTNRQQALLVV